MKAPSGFSDTIIYDQGINGQLLIRVKLPQKTDIRRRVETLTSSQSLDAAAIDVAQAVGLSGHELAIALLEQSSDCVKILSIDGHLEFMNCNGQAAMEIDHSGMVIGKLWWELWPKASQDFLRTNFNQVARGQEVEFEAFCPTAKGTPRRWRVNMRPLLAANGPVVSILATSRDITAG